MEAIPLCDKIEVCYVRALFHLYMHDVNFLLSDTCSWRCVR